MANYLPWNAGMKSEQYSHMVADHTFYQKQDTMVWKLTLATEDLKLVFSVLLNLLLSIQKITVNATVWARLVSYFVHYLEKDL